MQTPKTRSGSSEVPHKVSPRSIRQLKTTTRLDIDSVSSSSSSSQANNTKISKERSPKVIDRRSPRSPVPERKRPSRISELESQISQLQDELKKVKDQLILSESSKKKSQQDAEESKEKLLTLSAKLEESQNQYIELVATGEARDVELQIIEEERGRAWQSELESSQQHLSVDSTALASAVNEIQLLKEQLELVANCGSVLQTQYTESADKELLNLKQNLSETLSLMEYMKNQLKISKESEGEAQAFVDETSLQLEAAKRTVDILRADVAKDVDGYNSIALELDQSRERVNTLGKLVSKLKIDINDNESIRSEYFVEDHKFVEEGEDPNQIKEEICSLKSEVGQLRSAIEAAETKHKEEQIESTTQIRKAYELMEQIKSESSRRQCELEAELQRTKTNIEELKANLMDKETELQGIMEENENLNLKLENIMMSQKESGFRKEIKKLEECVAELKADMMDKETTLQSISEENEMLKLEISKSCGKVREEIEEAKAAEREAVAKLGIVMEEVDRSNRKAARVTEQLEATQSASSEMEAELRRLKVQSDQWRKAAEAAAAMLSAGNNGKLTERTVSLDNSFKCSPYAEDIDDDFQRKKNGNVLKKFGVLWKKPQK
ncbi:interactor of constitutive active ROPs 3 [Cicer arietinum]|uniref:Interactor of constitutive active ROPs 3 isoform X1 n=1 Tax=Cicer arietinum TaxID=3827 RepID=A0A1S2YKG9_CICAR|nr:interactor of constitutive active ROPs 3 isoform X1 [Cicer arietinum]XP_012572777.1 interactor of constitutive active ROPs 3 isoform X1 [Cicer arietinum]XP_027191974.1 interactor of constitutive active ROPs 3 isoform X1 [Cicer arietinum]XP_027191975.1 interactor of constitutive active ROPs 3 isoform X1 [Cicer arietinum]